MKLTKPMKNTALKNLILALLLIFTGSFMPLVAQTTVRGRVIDSKNNQTLPGTTVSVKGTYKAALTDIDGNYKIDVSSSKIPALHSIVTVTGKLRQSQFFGIVIDEAS